MLKVNLSYLQNIEDSFRVLTVLHEKLQFEGGILGELRFEITKQIQITLPYQEKFLSSPREVLIWKWGEGGILSELSFEVPKQS